MIKWGLFKTEVQKFITKPEMDHVMLFLGEKDLLPFHASYWGDKQVILFDRESDASRWLNYCWPSFVESNSRRFKFGQKPVDQLFKYTIKKQKVKL
jgi:hypothetical protein